MAHLAARAQKWPRGLERKNSWHPQHRRRRAAQRAARRWNQRRAGVARLPVDFWWNRWRGLAVPTLQALAYAAAPKRVLAHVVARVEHALVPRHGVGGREGDAWRRRRGRRRAPCDAALRTVRQLNSDSDFMAPRSRTVLHCLPRQCPTDSVRQLRQFRQPRALVLDVARWPCRTRDAKMS